MSHRPLLFYPSLNPFQDSTINMNRPFFIILSLYGSPLLSSYRVLPSPPPVLFLFLTDLLPRGYYSHRIFNSAPSSCLHKSCLPHGLLLPITHLVPIPPLLFLSCYILVALLHSLSLRNSSFSVVYLVSTSSLAQSFTLQLIVFSYHTTQSQHSLLHNIHLAILSSLITCPVSTSLSHNLSPRSFSFHHILSLYLSLTQLPTLQFIILSHTHPHPFQETLNTAQFLPVHLHQISLTYPTWLAILSLISASTLLDPATLYLGACICLSIDILFFCIRCHADLSFLWTM